MWRVALHVLEVEEVLAPLGHHLQVRKEVQKLSEFVLKHAERKNSINAMAQCDFYREKREALKSLGAEVSVNMVEKG